MRAMFTESGLIPLANGIEGQGPLQGGKVECFSKGFTCVQGFAFGRAPAVHWSHGMKVGRVGRSRLGDSAAWVQTRDERQNQGMPAEWNGGTGPDKAPCGGAVDRLGAGESASSSPRHLIEAPNRRIISSHLHSQSDVGHCEKGSSEDLYCRLPV